MFLLIVLGSISIAAADTIYLRGGSTLRGNVLGFINGRFAIQLTTNATLPVNPNNRNQGNTSGTTRTVSAGEVIFLRPRDIDRIEIDGRSLDDARYQTRTVDVSLDSNWIDSGVDLKRGERVRVDATGTINTGRTRITPADLSTTDPNSPLPRAAEGELIGVIGNDYDSPIIEIGASREFVADRDGRLYLTANRSELQRRRGVFKVQIRKRLISRRWRELRRQRNRTTIATILWWPGDSEVGPARTRSRHAVAVQSGIGGRRNNRTLEKTVAVPGNRAAWILESNCVPAIR